MKKRGRPKRILVKDHHLRVGCLRQRPLHLPNHLEGKRKNKKNALNSHMKHLIFLLQFICYSGSGLKGPYLFILIPSKIFDCPFKFIMVRAPTMGKRNRLDFKRSSLHFNYQISGNYLAIQV